MGKKRQRPQTSTRPEHAGPAEQLYAADHERYHGQNAGLQRDMAQLAVALLGLQGPAANLVADLGCGSGLSSAALSWQAGVGWWLGTDLTREMVLLAAAQQGGKGRVAVSDFGQGLPLRPGCLDGAISISAVQWLCSAADPSASICRFFSGLRSSLRAGARAALQVYPEGDGQAQQLVAGARVAGLDAGFFVAYPHATTAKKYYVLVQRPSGSPAGLAGAGQAGGNPGQLGACLSCRPCNLAWPKTGSCALSWLRHLHLPHKPGLAGLAGWAGPAQALVAEGQAEAQTEGQAEAQTEGQAEGQAGAQAEAASRMEQEHASVGKSMVRLLRRAVSLSEPGSSSGSSDGSGGKGTGAAAQPSAPTSCSTQDGDEGGSSRGGGGSSLTVHADLEVQHTGLMPCGGSIFLQITATAEILDPSTASQRPNGSGSEAADLAQQFAPAVKAAARQLLAGEHAATIGSGSSAAHCRVRHALIKEASAEDAALHARLRPGQHFRGPPAADGGAARATKPFMWLEPLEALQKGEQQQGQQQHEEQEQAQRIQQQQGQQQQHREQQQGQQQQHREQQQGQQQQPDQQQLPHGMGVAVLHVRKMSQHLALLISFTRGSRCGMCGSGANACSLGDREIGSSVVGGGSWCSACLVQHMQALCADLGGCVVGLDVHLLPSSTEATWVLFLSGLQYLDRGQLIDAVLRRFAAGRPQCFA